MGQFLIQIVIMTHISILRISIGILVLYLTGGDLCIIGINLLWGLPTEWHCRKWIIQTKSSWLHWFWFIRCLNDFFLQASQLVPFPFWSNHLKSWGIYWFWLQNLIGKVIIWPDFLNLQLSVGLLIFESRLRLKQVANSYGTLILLEQIRPAL